MALSVANSKSPNLPLLKTSKPSKISPSIDGTSWASTLISPNNGGRPAQAASQIASSKFAEQLGSAPARDVAAPIKPCLKKSGPSNRPVFGSSLSKTPVNSLQTQKKSTVMPVEKTKFPNAGKNILPSVPLTPKHMGGDSDFIAIATPVPKAPARILDLYSSARSSVSREASPKEVNKPGRPSVNDQSLGSILKKGSEVSESFEDQDSMH
ncbi:hypothetical protein C8J56DRAFT_1037684 [Mycena floridula]|nr:hypothetical protein C8J56DRAFT_1037684 [Mycena floridula]